MHTQETISKFRQILLNEREKLVAELKEIATPDPAVKGNWTTNYPKFEENESGSSGSLETEQDEVEEYEVRLEAEHSIESRLLEVTKALERIAKGIYGICSMCKKDIPTDRLTANPAAEFDMEHQK